MITAIVLASIGLLCGVAALVYGIHVAVVFQRFNDGIKDWANALDDSMRAAIDRQAMEILQELDDKITEQKALENQEADVVEEDETLTV